MKKIMQFLKRQWITVWLVISAITLTLTIVYAAYLGNTEVKRVVSTASISNVFFSSNMLDSSSNGLIKNIKTAETTQNYECLVSIFNYDEMMPTNFAKDDIPYRLTATLYKYDTDSGTFQKVTNVVKSEDDSRNEVFSIQKVKDNNTNVSESEYNLNTGEFMVEYPSEVLQGGASHANTYKLIIDKEEVAKDVPIFYIRLEAEPSAQNIDGVVARQSGYISASKGTVYNSGWSGELSERTERSYDGYNMIISGSGTGTIDLSWNNERFEINKFFLEQYAYDSSTGTGIDSEGVKVNGTTSKITLHVDSIVSNRYEVQFYKKTKGNYNLETVKSSIKCNNYVSD
ncbi:MAG: hypothetical protein K6G63_02055 [Eubacterium sp.]|nr:hypothetical protein [Eubacterium sp.]